MPNEVIALTQRPLTEREGWEWDDRFLLYYRNKEGFDPQRAKQTQALADQPLLWEEITRLEAALAEALEEAVTIVKDVTMESAQGFIGTFCSFTYSGEDIVAMFGNIAGQSESRIRALHL